MATDENNMSNREDCPDLSQAEVSRLRSEIRELGLKLEKANNKLPKMKNELESERENSKTLRKFIHELNKVQLLERSPPPPPSPLNASIQSPQTPAMHLAVSGEFVQKLVMDKTGLESQMCEQKREIELLKSKLTQSIDTQQQMHSDLLLKEQQLEECKSDYLKLEGERQLGKQLFEKAKHYLSAEKEQLQQEMDWERDRNKKLHKRIGESLQNKQQLEAQITELLESITEYKKRDQELTNEISLLQNTNKQSQEDMRKLDKERNAMIEELREINKTQQQTIEHNNKHTGEVVNAEFMLRAKEFFSSKDVGRYYSTWQFKKTESELIYEIKIQKQELEEYKAMFSRNDEDTDLVTSLISEKSLLKLSIGEMRELKVKLTTEKAEQHEILALMGELHIANNRIMKLKQPSLTSEEHLRGKILELGKENMELTEKIFTQKKQISEQNKQIAGPCGVQEHKGKSLSKHKTKDKQISDLRIQILELQEKEKSYQKQKRSSGATPGATFYDFTSQIVPVANVTGKFASKILIRSDTHVNVVKLKSLPYPNEYRGEQAILSINKHNELGVIMVIFELPGKVGLRSVTSKYVGIKLNNPVGNSGGEFRTKRHFDCEPKCAIFAPFEDVLIPVV